MSQMLCPHCKKGRLVWNSQDQAYVCSRCGYVLEQLVLDEQLEMIKAINTGGRGPIIKPGEELEPSIITMSEKDIRGRIITGVEKRRRIRGIIKAQKETYKRIIKERKDRKVEKALMDVCMKLGVPKTIVDEVREVVKHIIIQLKESKISEGKHKVRVVKSYRVLIAAILKLILEKQHILMDTEEICQKLGLAKNEFLKAYQTARLYMKPEERPKIHERIEQKIENIINLIFFEKNFDLERKGEALKCSLELYRKLRNHGRFMIGKKPSAIAATVTYMTLKLLGFKISQKDIAQAAKISEVTLRNMVKHILDNFELAFYV